MSVAVSTVAVTVRSRTGKGTSLTVRGPTVTTGLTLAGISFRTYEGWNFNSGNYLFTTDTK